MTRFLALVLRVELKPLVFDRASTTTTLVLVVNMVLARAKDGRIRTSLTTRGRVRLLKLLEHLNGGALSNFLFAVTVNESCAVMIVEVLL